MPNVTLAFDKGVKGWTSEFTFLPETGLSLNNTFYTGGRGLLWKHNSVDVARNEFYTTGDVPVVSPTTVEFVFNDNVTQTKNYKTLEYQGSSDWDVEMKTNLEKGSIATKSFIPKDGKRHAWIRGEDNRFTTSVDPNSANGIGLVVEALQSSGIYRFDELPHSIGKGDVIYRIKNISGTFGSPPTLVGIVDSISGKTLTLTSTGIPGEIDGENLAFAPADTGDYCLYVKNNEVNKSGIIGYFNIVTMTHNIDAEAELFSASTSTFITSE